MKRLLLVLACALSLAATGPLSVYADHHMAKEKVEKSCCHACTCLDGEKCHCEGGCRCAEMHGKDCSKCPMMHDCKCQSGEQCSCEGECRCAMMHGKDCSKCPMKHDCKCTDGSKCICKENCRCAKE